MASDEYLMRRVQERDARAFEELLQRHAPRLRRRLAGMVRDEAAAEDLLQEASLRLWTRADQWRGEGSAKGWLLRTATNLALNHLRSRRRRREQPLGSGPAQDREAGVPSPTWDVDGDALRPDTALEAADRADLIRQILDDMPETKRDVLRLAHEHDMKMQEIAEVLGIPEGTVKSRLHYAGRELAQEWRKRWEGT